MNSATGSIALHSGHRWNHNQPVWPGNITLSAVTMHLHVKEPRVPLAPLTRLRISLHLSDQPEEGECKGIWAFKMLICSIKRRLVGGSQARNS